MRLFSVLTCCVLSTLVTQAQVRVALTGGLNNTSITPQLVHFNDTSATVTKRTALHVGLMADLPIQSVPKLYLQTGVGYAARGAQFQQFFDSGSHRLFFNS